MKRIRILIADFDKNFTDAFMKYIIDFRTDQVGIAMVNHIDKLLDLKSAYYKAEILMISKEFLKMIPDIKLEDMAEVIAVMSDEENVAQRDGCNGPVPYFFYSKYMNMTKLMNDVILEYTDFSEKNGRQKLLIRKAKMIVITSPAGGSGKTFIAFEMAKGLSQKGKNVLLISMEDVSSLQAWIDVPEEKSGGLSKIFLMLKNNLGNMGERASQLAVRDEAADISYISPSEIPGELSGITFEEVAKAGRLFESEYDYIVIDGGICESTQLMKIAAEVHKVLMILRNDKASLHKGNLLIDYFKQKDHWIMMEEQLMMVFNKSNGLPVTWPYTGKTAVLRERSQEGYENDLDQLVKRVL